MEEQVRVLIIGSGPAGYTAAIYASRANLKPVLYEGIEPGGQLTTTTDVENFPGHPDSVSGPDLMGLMRRQAERFGADIRTGNVTRADLSSRPFHVVIDGEKEIKAETLIIATGATAKYLGLPSETKFRGQGVSACATCDGFFYRKKDVAVVGGGDTACEEATYLASLCRKVYLIVRKPHLRASKAMQQRVFNTPNIEVLFEHNTAEVLGDDSGVTGALLRRNDGSERKIDIAGFFLAIGHHPNTELFAEQLALDAEGYIKVEPGTSKTSVEGVFAAGDVKDPHYRQAITAAASGCVAALDCERVSAAIRQKTDHEEAPFTAGGGMLHRLVRRNPHHLYRQSLSDNRNRAGTLFRLEGRSLGLRNDGQHQGDTLRQDAGGGAGPHRTDWPGERSRRHRLRRRRERNLRPDLHDDRKDREKRRRQQNPNRHHIPERFHDQPASGDIHKV